MADRTREQISEAWSAATDGRELSDYLWDEVLTAREQRDRARLHLVRERDEARAEVAALVEHRETVRVGGLAATEQLIRDRSKAEQERDEALEARDSAEATIARLQAELQAEVVELTQAGDLHRKEGDEARALLREAFPFVEATTKRAHAQGGYNLLRRMGACLADATCAPVEPRTTVLADVRAERIRPRLARDRINVRRARRKRERQARKRARRGGR